MTSRQRLLDCLAGKIPDRVPVMPDISNMIPVKRTGLPFWDIYLYEHIPLWKAYINAVKYFGFDSLYNGVYIDLPGIDNTESEWTQAIVKRTDTEIITQEYKDIGGGKKQWAETVMVYFRDNPPSWWVHPHKIHLPLVPDKYQDVTGKTVHPKGGELLTAIKNEMGEHGLVGVSCGTTSLVGSEEQIYEYYDYPEIYHKRRDDALDYFKRKFHALMSLDDKPDFIATGTSGTLVFQTEAMFRELGLPIVKMVTALCKRHGIPSHVHSCGPEAALVKIMAEETDLTVIDPLEIPPMGDCDLKELKKLYGDKLVLKGNLHTINIMLNGTTEQVKEACKRAIDDAAEGGRFILSTGDQCGRDTPEDNIFTMIEIAKTYGKY